MEKEIDIGFGIKLKKVKKTIPPYEEPFNDYELKNMFKKMKGGKKQ